MNIKTVHCKKNFNDMIDNYHKIFVTAFDKNHNLKIAIRSYYSKAELHFLIVDPYSLETSCVKAKDLSYRRPDIGKNHLSRYVKITDLLDTPYFKALKFYNQQPISIENHGLQKASYAVQGCFLTVDLCPSNNNFEKGFFEKLIELSDANNMPTPVGICISGLWLVTHQAEFEWLKQQQEQKKLNITWINHSLTHPYYSDLPYPDNFLNYREDNFEYEILDTEKLLLEAGIVPSIFFRFPGLVSNSFTIKKLEEYGLVPLGSSSWLSKNEPIKNGNIILIHANGNEVHGIVEKFLTSVKEINFLPITKALIKN